MFDDGDTRSNFVVKHCLIKQSLTVCHRLKRDVHCDGWTEQSNNSCVTMRNPLYLVTVYGQ